MNIIDIYRFKISFTALKDVGQIVARLVYHYQYFSTMISIKCIKHVSYAFGWSGRGYL